MLSDNAYLTIAPELRICRLLSGLWQLSGGHGYGPTAAQSIPNMLEYHDDGLTTWDLADHYGPAEEYIRLFRAALSARDGESALSRVQAFTKWVPRPGRMTRQIVEQAIDTSRERMGMDTLDMVQFHWWDYADPGYLDALAHMADLQTAGKLKHLSLTNFDTEHTRRIVTNGIHLVSNQVQFSIIDRRPEVAMIPFCAEHGMHLLTYGTLCGGLLTDKFLNVPEPGAALLNTASLKKYKNMIDAWGGWSLFQELLTALHRTADRHGVSIANVAVRYILQKPQVGGVIAGVRLGLSDNRLDNMRIFSFALDDADLTAIHTVTERSRDLFRLIGDCGDEYRR